MGFTNVKKVGVVKLATPKVDEKHDYIDDATDKKYSTIEALVSDNTPHNSDSVNVSIKGNYLSYDIEELQLCCGVLEIGNLSVNTSIDIKELTKYLDSLVVFTKHKTLIINTNGKDFSVTFEKALAKCKNWVNVKQFRNNSPKGNLITMWISKNE